MTDKQQPAQFDWATELSDAQGHVTLSEQEAHEIGARLEIESLQARIKTMAEEHAAELHRLHAYCKELEAQVILDCMTHGQQSAEIEHVVGDVSKNGAESNMAQQPAPSAAHVVADALADSQYLAGVSAGWNAANADDPNSALQKLHESRAGYLKPLSAPKPSPTPQADSQPVPVVDKCAKQQMTTEVLRRMQQQEDGHNKNPFRSLLDRLMRNEGGYSTIEIGQLKYALDGFYGAARATPQPATADAELLDFMEKHPEKWLRYRKGKWAFEGFTNYEFDMYPSLREALAAAKREVKP